MADQNLLDYIKNCRTAGQADGQIKLVLLGAGWPEKDVNEGLAVVSFVVESSLASYGEQTGNVVSAQKKGKHKVLKIILIVFGCLTGIIVLIYLLPFIFGFVTKDGAPPNVEDLKLQTVIIPKEDNAYYDLLAITGESLNTKAALAVYEPKGSEVSRLYIAGQEWDQKYAEDVVVKNNAIFSLFDAAVRKPKYQDPNTDSPEKIGPNTFLTSLNPLRSLARIEAIRALYLFKQGKEQEGLDEAIKIMNLGQKIQDSQITLIQYLIAVSIKGTGLDVFATMMSKTHLAAGQLASYIEKLKPFQNNQQGLVSAFKSEFAVIANAEKEMLGVALKEYETKGFSLNPVNNVKGESFYFRPNQTSALFADNTRERLALASKSCSALLGVVDGATGEPKSTPSLISLYFTQNAVGKLLYELSAVSLNGVQYKRCDEELEARAAQLLTALKAYKSENGNYPATLENLVPRFISVLPDDSYSGEAMKYDIAKNIIYSVGRDKKDVGGSAGEDWRKMANPTFKIE